MGLAPFAFDAFALVPHWRGPRADALTVLVTFFFALGVMFWYAAIAVMRFRLSARGQLRMRTVVTPTGIERYVAGLGRVVVPWRDIDSIAANRAASYPTSLYFAPFIGIRLRRYDALTRSVPAEHGAGSGVRGERNAATMSAEQRDGSVETTRVVRKLRGNRDKYDYDLIIWGSEMRGSTTELATFLRAYHARVVRKARAVRKGRH